MSTTSNSKSKNGNTLWDKTDFVFLKPDAKYVTPVDKAWTFAVSDDKYLLANDSTGVVAKLAKVSDILSSKDYTLRYMPSEPNDAFKAMTTINTGKPYKFNYQGFLPWKNFDREKIILNVAMEQPLQNGYRIGLAGHTKFLELKPTSRAIHATKVHTLLGVNTNSAIGLFICYSENGATKLAKDIDYKAIGNLTFYFRIIDIINSEKEHIKVINLANENYEEELNNWLTPSTTPSE